MAYAGYILPLYHGNESETDLKLVGDIDETLISPWFVPAAGKFALARMLQMQLRAVKELESNEKLPNWSTLARVQPTLFRLSAVTEMQQNPAKLGLAPEPDMRFCR